MEKYYKILYYLNQNPFENQRALARGVEMSLGQVNGLMRQLTEEGYLEKQGGNIQLTEKAESFLEQMTRQNQTGRLIFEKRKKKIDTAVILAALVLFIPVFGPNAAKIGLVLIGLGCAPIYPSIVHATPARFGAARSQAIIGMQMAVAYVGICLLPPLFGLLADHVTIWLFPVYMLAVTVVMGLMHEKAVKRAGNV